MGSPRLVVSHAGVCPKRAVTGVALAPWTPMQVGMRAPSHPVPCPPNRPHQEPSTPVLVQLGGHMASPHSVRHTGEAQVA